MMNRANRLAIVGISLALPAIAMNDAAAHATSTQNCKLHMWPTKHLSAANIGSSMSGLLPALVAGSSAKQGELASAVLDGEGQLAQVMSADPVSLFKLPTDTAIVSHEAPELKTPVGKPAPTFEPRCRHELRVGSIIYGRHPLYGKDIVSRFTFQTINADGKITRKYNKQARIKMHDFPDNSLPKDDQERQIMADMMNGAFKAGFVKFVSSIKEFR